MYPHILSYEHILKKYIHRALETVYTRKQHKAEMLPFNKIFIFVENHQNFEDDRTLGFIESVPDHKKLKKFRKNDDVYFNIVLNKKAWWNMTEYYRFKLIAHEFGHFAEMYLHGNCSHNYSWKKWAKWFGDEDPRAIEKDIVF